MSIFSGKFHKLPGVKGKLTDQTPELRATMEQVDNGPKATVNRVAGITGAFYRMGRWLKAAVRPLDILYRFLAARQTVRQTHSAKETTAPAVTMEAGGKVTHQVEASLNAQPAAEVKVDSQPREGVFAQLVAYNRAAAVYIANILTGHLAGLGAAPGAVAKFRKAVRLERTSKAEAAGSAIMESRFNRSATGSTATGSTAPAQDTPAVETVFTADSTATAGQAVAVEASGHGRQDTVHGAGLSTWFLPEYADGTLSIFQVFSGVQSGDTVEIDCEENSAYWAKNMVTAGVLGLVFTETVTQTGNTLEVN